MRRKLSKEEKRERVNVLLSQREREILAEKMEKYGYKDLSPYLRDAGIYEKLYLEDINGKQELANLMNDLVKKIEKIQLDQKVLYLRKDLSVADKMTIKKQNQDIYDEIKNLAKVMKEILWVDVKKVIADETKVVEQPPLFNIAESKKESG